MFDRIDKNTRHMRERKHVEEIRYAAHARDLMNETRACVYRNYATRETAN